MFWQDNFLVTKKVGFLIILLLTFLLLIGCSEQTEQGELGEAVADSSTINGDQVSKFPLTITDSANRSITFEESPKRIITVVPADMEIIYALGGKVVGRPKKSVGEVYPPEAAEAEVVGHPRLINFEEVSALKGDMFVGHIRANLRDVPTLETLNLNVLLTQSDSIGEIISLIEMYGDILDKEEQADMLIHTIEEKVEEILEANQGRNVKALILVGTVEETMAALPQSLSGNIFETVGIKNICEGMPALKSAPTYAQLSLERILESDPDVIYFMSMGDDEKTFEKFQAEISFNPIWDELTAIKNDHFIVLPHELFGINPGTRIVESLQFLKDSLDSLGY